MKKILLIYGGNSSENNVSKLSAKSIIENIDKEKFKLYQLEITKDNDWKTKNIIKYLKKFDVIFPIIHGKNGEDGKLQGMLDLFNIKYVGAKTTASALCMDKEYMKDVFKSLNMPQAPYIVLKEESKINIPFPLIVKPANSGSSIGMTKVNNKEELNEAIEIAKKYDNKIIIEKFMQIRELECSVLEDKDNLIISDIGEIKPAKEFYDYEAKYENKHSQTIIPADIPEEIKKEIKEISKLLFIKFDLKGLSRIDFFYDETNKKVFINEINTLPGFTKISMYPKLLMSIGISYKDIITKLIENAT